MDLLSLDSENLQDLIVFILRYLSNVRVKRDRNNRSNLTKMDEKIPKYYASLIESNGPNPKYLRIIKVSGKSHLLITDYSFCW